MKNIIIGLIILGVIGGGIWYLSKNKVTAPEEKLIVTTIETDSSLPGVIEANQKIVVKNGVKVSVDGDLKIDGVLVCEGGALDLAVKGNLTVNKRIECNRTADVEDAAGISVVVGGSVEVAKDAEVVSNSNVQIVSSRDALALTQEQIDALYEEAGKDTGTGPRIGPFVESGATQNVKVGRASISGPIVIDAKAPLLPFIQTARAQAPSDDQGNVVPNVILGGKWYIGNGGPTPGGLQVPTPPKNVNKIILNFDFGDSGNVELKDFYLVGPDGRDGKSDTGQSCSARGEAGENAFRMRVNAANVTLNNFTLQLGNGGKGGDAETTKDCDPGIAVGGRGGEAGNFKMTAVGKISILSFHIIPGMGGFGGNATGQGRDGVDGCPGQKGGDARATGGEGGKNKKELVAIGAVEGIANVTIDRVDGGIGGKAVAKPGTGGNGTGCNCKGGKGGDATTTGGKGGDASLKIIGAAGAAIGGNGGDADSHGGNGGTGGQCPLKPSGGNGGNGGKASSKAGKAGNGTSGNGADGTVIDETGGDGGNGGDGCGPGNGGTGGIGKPKGNDGEPGKKICPEIKKETPTTALPPSGGTTPPPPPPQSEIKTVKVIQYQGKYLPVDQLIVEDEAGCGADHWHAAQGVVKATDGTPVPDPGPQCGYGKVNQNPVMDYKVPADYEIRVRGLESIGQ